ncbi:ankyrin repeat-containing domain protein [Nemania abortiva]|nr:ankyrin repeat-containing domain protein [Nemania abortiva]
MGSKPPEETSQRPQGKYKIYLVGFPDIAKDFHDLQIAQLIYDHVPEATVILHDILRDGLALSSLHGPRNEVGSEETGRNLFEDDDQPDLHDGVVDHNLAPNTVNVPHFSYGWLEKEALGLLGRIQKHGCADENGECCQILLAGYGFGGLVLKQAVIMANTSPRFYNIALILEDLVFFATPHRSTGRLAWGEVVLDMIEQTEKDSHSQPLHMLPALVDSISWLSREFGRFSSKYPITNFIASRWAKHLNTIELKSVFESAGSWWNHSGDQDISLCNLTDSGSLMLLRTHFVPPHILTKLHHGTIENELQQPINETYFRLLQTLSPSRRFLYESRTFDRSDNLNDIGQVYRSLLHQVMLEDVRGGSIQVTGPSGHGRSALVKLIAQQLRRDSPVLIVDNFIHLSDNQNVTLYGVCASVLHQILCQKPALLRPVENLVAQILEQRVWSEQAIQLLLSSIFLHAENMDLVMVICDIESWPSLVRSWWPKIPSWLPESSNCTFVTSGHAVDKSLTPGKMLHFDLNNQSDEYRKAFIKARIRTHLNNAHRLGVRKEALNEVVQRDIVAAAESFKGSLASLSGFLSGIFQSFTLSAPKAISNAISSYCDFKENEEQFYVEELASLGSRYPTTMLWIVPALYWVLLAERPLHVRELAAATAINLNCSKKIEIHENISIDMQYDLQNHLSCFLAIESQHVRLINPIIQKLSLERNKSTFYTHSDLALRCLHYLGIVLADDSPSEWEKCLLYISNKQQTRNPPDPVLEFLHYACLFWPSHFLRAETLDKDLIREVAKFLQRPKVASQWFKLYLLCTDMKDREMEVTGLAAESPKNVHTGNYAHSRPSAVVETRATSALIMAGHLGLTSVTAYLLNEGQTERDFHVFPVRRGHLEHNVILDASSRDYYIESLIACDDDGRIEQLLEGDQEAMTKHYPLHMAALAGNPRTFHALFNSMDNPAQKNEDGRTLLHMAAMGGSLDIIRFLVGDDVSEVRNGPKYLPGVADALDMNKQTPLILAIRMGHVDAAKYLVCFSLLLTTRDKYGKTALHYAVIHCPQVVEDIAAKDLTIPQVQDNDGHTPLHVAARIGSILSASAIVNTLRGANCLDQTLGVRDSSKRTALHYVAGSGDIRLAQVFHNKDGGLRPYLMAEDTSLNIPAEVAAQCGHLTVMRLMASWMIREPRDRLLLAASKAGQLLIVQYLLESGTGPDVRGSNDLSALSLAASGGYDTIVLTLLRNKAQINLGDVKRRTALHHAAARGRCSVVRTLLAWNSESSERAHLNTPDLLGFTPLHLAAKAGQIEAMELLLRRGADFDARSREKQNPLHLAVEYPQAIELLLTAGAAVNCTDVLAQTPLHLATRMEHLESAKVLIKRGAKLDAEDIERITPLSHAIAQNDLPMVEEFFGAEPNTFRNHMWDNLKVAVAHSALGVAQFIAGNPTDVANTAINNQVNELLYIAAGVDCPDMLVLLVSLGADVKSHWDTAEKTPLHAASGHCLVQNLHKLIELGADINATDRQKNTPLHDAAKENKAEAISILIGEGAPINALQEESKTPLLIAAHHGCAAAAEVLLRNGADVTKCDDRGWSPLHAAADCLETASLLLDYKADISYSKQDGWSPLHFASSWGHPSIVQLFLEHGGNPNSADEHGDTPLHIALKTKNDTVVRVMLEHSGSNAPNPNILDGDGIAPIYLATQNNSSALVRLLLSKGAELKFRTAEGKTCLTLAVKNGLDKALDVLLSREQSGTGWEHEDMVAAYWQTIKGNQSNSGFVRCMELLLSKRPSLVDELSDKGHNGLETYFLMARSVRSHEKSRSMPRLFIHRGVDPFRRRFADKPSAFELGMVFYDWNNDEDMEVFAKYISTDIHMSPPSFGFRELRILTELDGTTLLKRIEPLMQDIKNDTDQDGWSIHDFISQSEPRLGFVTDKVEATKDAKTPAAILCPPAWQVRNLDAGPGVEISTDGLGALFEDREHEDGKGSVSVRADFPFPPLPNEISYFEVSIEALGNASGSNRGSGSSTVSIGLCGEFSNLAEAYLGQKLWSVGFYGDDGQIFENCHGTHCTERLFRPGNTVGCGVDYSKGEYFFTLDGEVIARHSSTIVYRKLYPCIGHAQGEVKIRVNFGTSKFAWKELGTLNLEVSDKGLPIKKRLVPWEAFES